MRFFSFFKRPSRRQSRPCPQHTGVLRLEVLEDRSLPSASPANPVQGYTLTILGGSGQTAPLGTYFDNRLQVRVEYNGQPVPHALVGFTAPNSGPSGDFGPQFVMFPIPHIVYPTDIGVSADENGVATAPSFEANGLSGTYSVIADIPGPGTSVSFTLANGVFPGPLPPSVNQQLLVNSVFPGLLPPSVNQQLLLNLLALPSVTNPQAKSDLANQFGTWLAFSYLQSPQQTSLLVQQEFNLTEALLLAGGNYLQFQNNFAEWRLCYETSLNPMYNTLLGYGTALLESELLLATVEG